MAVINKLINLASVLYDGKEIDSNAAETNLLLAPLIAKAVDQNVASIGDILTYTVKLTNEGLIAITDLPLTDILPAGSTYLADSFTVDQTAATPVLTGNTLTYTIPTLAPEAVTTVSYQVTVVGGNV